MDIEELQKKMIEFRDARDWAQINQMTDNRRHNRIQPEARMLEINEKKYPVEKAKGSAKKYTET
jgi:hypothetical protein